MINIVDKQYKQFYNNFLNGSLHSFINGFLSLMEDVSKNARYFFAGNGASAAIASHLANDFSKALDIRATTFHDPALLTCFGNDYGYENWISEAIKLYGDRGDVLVLISSSGRSKNIVNAAVSAKSKGLKVVALTGPQPDPILLQHSILTLKVDTNIYNVIECCHMIALCAVVDSCNTVTLDGLSGTDVYANEYK